MVINKLGLEIEENWERIYNLMISMLDKHLVILY